MFAGLTVAENLRLAAAPRAWSRTTTRSTRSSRNCVPAARQRAGTLSGGQQQMVAIARVLLNPNVLLLVDEPTKGLAPKVVTEVADVLERVARSGTDPAGRAEPRRGAPAGRCRGGPGRRAGQLAPAPPTELLGDAERTRTLLGVGGSGGHR